MTAQSMKCRTTVTEEKPQISALYLNEKSITPKKDKQQFLWYQLNF